jgi:hypothetical protein
VSGRIEWSVVRTVELGGHPRTRRTKHSAHGRELPTPAALMIAQLPPDPGFYLLYLDVDGNEMTDTYHDAVGGALAQAQWEFDLTESEWVGRVG